MFLVRGRFGIEYSLLHRVGRLELIVSWEVQWPSLLLDVVLGSMLVGFQSVAQRAFVRHAGPFCMSREMRKVDKGVNVTFENLHSVYLYSVEWGRCLHAPCPRDQNGPTRRASESLQSPTCSCRARGHLAHALLWRGGWKNMQTWAVWPCWFQPENASKLRWYLPSEMKSRRRRAARSLDIL